MTFPILRLLPGAILLLLAGCHIGAETEAVDLCYQQTPQIEAKQIPNLKATVRRGHKVTELGSSHFLVEVDYQLVTIEDPNPQPSGKGFWSIKTITCEVKDGIIVDGAMLGSKSDQVLRDFPKPD